MGKHQSRPKRLSGKAAWLKHGTPAVHRFTIVAGLHRQLQPQPTRQRDIGTQPDLPWPVEVLDAPPLQRLARVQAMQHWAATTCTGYSAEPTAQRPCQRGGRPAVLGAEGLDDPPQRYTVNADTPLSNVLVQSEPRIRC